MKLLAVTALAAALGTASAIHSVPSLNVSLYTGRWYQMYSDVATSIFETNYCVTADYGVNPNGTVSVHNRDRQSNTTGPETQIYGYATQDNATSAPGQLTVYLQGPPAGAPYWVVMLGDVYEYDGVARYSYAVVTDPLQLTLFVLARDPKEFYARWNTSLYDVLLNSGFNNVLNTPEPTNQLGCEYWPAGARGDDARGAE